MVKRFVNIPSSEDESAVMSFGQAAAYFSKYGLTANHKRLQRLFDADKLRSFAHKTKGSAPTMTVKAANEIIVCHQEFFPRPKDGDLPFGTCTVLDIVDLLGVPPFEVMKALERSEVVTFEHDKGYYLVQHIDLDHLASLLGVPKERRLTSLAPFCRPAQVEQGQEGISTESSTPILPEKDSEPERADTSDTGMTDQKAEPIPASSDAPKRKHDIFTVQEAADFLLSLGFSGSTLWKLYYHIRKKEIKVHQTKPKTLICETELIKLIDTRPNWLMRSPNRVEPPEGYLTGILMAEQNDLHLGRVYCAFREGLIDNYSASPDEYKHQIWFVRIEDVEEALSVPVLHDFLKGNRVTVEEVREVIGSTPIRGSSDRKTKEPSDVEYSGCPEEHGIPEFDQPPEIEEVVEAVQEPETVEFTLNDAYALIGKAYLVLKAADKASATGQDLTEVLKKLV